MCNVCINAYVVVVVFLGLQKLILKAVYIPNYGSDTGQISSPFTQDTVFIKINFLFMGSRFLLSRLLKMLTWS